MLNLFQHLKKEILTFVRIAWSRSRIGRWGVQKGYYHPISIPTKSERDPSDKRL
jgi:hypothetical protein